MVSIGNKKIMLVLLLALLATLFRMTFEHPWHPDHYTIGQYTYMILENGYAPWVLHPLSLAGYYPLSVPSGLEFFIAYFSNMTGLSLPVIFYIGAIFNALLGGLLLFLMLREFMNFENSFVTSMIFLTLANFVRDTSNTASTRVFSIIFYPLFIFFLFRIYRHYSEMRNFRIKYIVSAVLVFLLMTLIHRLSQMAIIFLIAFLLSFAITRRAELLAWYKRRWMYTKRKKFYDSSKFYILTDLLAVFAIVFGFNLIRLKTIWLLLVLTVAVHYTLFNFGALKKKRASRYLQAGIYVGLIILAKFIDLAVRGRLLTNLTKILSEHLMLLLALPLIPAAASFAAYILLRKRGLTHFVKRQLDKLTGLAKRNFDMTLSLVLLGVFLLFVSRSFTGESFYSFGFEHYTSSFLMEGTSPHVILVNFLFNLNNNLSILISFALIGILYLFFKRTKTFYDYFLVFIAIGFAQFLLDWEYVRLFMTAVYATFIGVGLMFFLKKVSERKQLVAYALVIMFLSAHFAVANFFVEREMMLDKLGLQSRSKDIPEPYFVQAGEFLKTNPEEFSIHTSSSITYDRRAAYYSKKNVAAIADSRFIDPSNFLITRRSFDELFDAFFKGETIKGIYEINDKIFGGSYYFGKYIVRLNSLDGETTASSSKIRSIAELFKIHYLIDSPRTIRDNKFFLVEVPVKNKVYSSGELQIYDLERGRNA